MPEPTAEQRFAVLARRLTTKEGVTLGSGRRGFGSDALQVNGRIFAMLRRGELVLKLPRERVAALVESGEGGPFDAGKGRPMQEWVTLDPASGERWLTLATEALTFVGSAGDDRSVR